MAAIHSSLSVAVSGAKQKSVMSYSLSEFPAYHDAVDIAKPLGFPVFIDAGTTAYINMSGIEPWNTPSLYSSLSWYQRSHQVVTTTSFVSSRLPLPRPCFLMNPSKAIPCGFIASLLVMRRITRPARACQFNSRSFFQSWFSSKWCFKILIYFSGSGPFPTLNLGAYSDKCEPIAPCRNCF